ARPARAYASASDGAPGLADPVEDRPMACHFETSPRGRERAFGHADAAPKVYVVGDDAALRERLVFWLARADFRASGFADAAAFQQAFAASRSDLVVVDIERERGLALACLLREHPGIGV